MKVLNKHKDMITDNAIYIGRGSKWGNPFKVGKNAGMVWDRNKVCELYEKYADRKFTTSDIAELINKDLVCFCAPKRCHGDYLLLLAKNLCGFMEKHHASKQ